jgi:hypothetical protein
MVIKMENEKIMLKVLCYDIDARHPVVETHVQMYAFHKDFTLVPLRIICPNDDLGARLVTSLPVQVIHHVDHHSVCSPRKFPLVEDSNGLFLRGVDSATANQEEIVCPVCGESYGTYERLRNHVRYNKIIEERDDFPVETSHLGFEVPEVTPLTLLEVQQHMEANISEIVVIVEGIDPQLSGTFQALQSYKYEDIVWEGDFEPCLSKRDNKFIVDMLKFQMIRVFETLIEEQDDVEQRPPISSVQESFQDDGVVVMANGDHSVSVSSP